MPSATDRSGVATMTSMPSRPSKGPPAVFNSQLEGPTQNGGDMSDDLNYRHAREQAFEDLGTFRDSLDAVLKLLHGPIATPLPKALLDNQSARQYNAALPNRHTPIAPLVAWETGKMIIELLDATAQGNGVTIDVLDDMHDEDKRHILSALGTQDTPIHEESESLKRQLRVAIGLQAVPVL